MKSLHSFRSTLNRPSSRLVFLLLLTLDILIARSEKSEASKIFTQKSEEAQSVIQKSQVAEQEREAENNDDINIRLISENVVVLLRTRVIFNDDFSDHSEAESSYLRFCIRTDDTKVRST